MTDNLHNAQLEHIARAKDLELALLYSSGTVTMGEIAAELGISRERVRQRLARVGVTGKQRGWSDLRNPTTRRRFDRQQQRLRRLDAKAIERRRVIEWIREHRPTKLGELVAPLSVNPQYSRVAQVAAVRSRLTVLFKPHNVTIKEAHRGKWAGRIVRVPFTLAGVPYPKTGRRPIRGPAPSIQERQEVRAARAGRVGYPEVRRYRRRSDGWLAKV